VAHRSSTSLIHFGSFRKSKWRDFDEHTRENVQTVKNFFAAMGRGDKPGLLALSAEDIEWIIPGEDWPLAGTHRGHQGLADLLQRASGMETSFPAPPEFERRETGF
jgi:hypothetical protein